MNEQFILEAQPFEGDLEQDLGRSGRWIRQCSKIIVLPATKPLSEDHELYELSGNGIPAATPRVLTYSTRDVIDARISIPAQHSLVRLSKNPATSADAVGMLEQVKAGRLAGIYCVNWQKPAHRALRFGKSWWTVIPPGEDAVLMLDLDKPLAGQPLIAFRRELDPDCGLLKGEKRFAASPSRLDAALLKAWSVYRLRQIGRLVTCASPPPDGPPTTIAIATEIRSTSAPVSNIKLSSGARLSNLVPPILCAVKLSRLRVSIWANPQFVSTKRTFEMLERYSTTLPCCELLPMMEP